MFRVLYYKIIIFSVLKINKIVDQFKYLGSLMI